MLNISTAFKQELYNGNRKYQIRAVITLADSTVLTVNNENIMYGGVGVEDAVSNDGNFSALGATVINSSELTLYNNNEVYSDYIFEGAKVVLYVGLMVPYNDTTILEEIKKGTYYVDEANYGDATITLNLLDNMTKFDKPYSQSNILYPQTLSAIVRDACTICGVTLATNSLTFPHDDYSVTERPNDESTTFREVIGWCATIAGCFARCNVNGELEFKWFDTDALENTEGDLDGGEFDSDNPYSTGDTADGGTFNPWNTGYVADGGAFTDSTNLHYITKLYSQNIAVDDVVITGVQIAIEIDTDSSDNIKTYTSGTTDYLVKIEKNKFITEDTALTVLSWLSTLLIGVRFRPCNVTHTDSPAIEAGDVGLMWDTKGKEHPILITRVTFNPGRPQTIVCGAESPAKNSSTRFTEATKAYVETRKQLQKMKSTYDEALDSLSERLDNAGGLYETAVTQPDQSVIIYYHNKPDLNDSDIQLVISDVGVTVTPDGGTTWYGLTVDGQLIGSIMNTIGLNFDWGVGGELVIRDTHGNEQFYADTETGAVRIEGTTLTEATNEAAKTATNYITYIDTTNGIRIYDGDPSNRNVNYAQINAYGMDVYENSVKVANFGETATIGKATSSRAYLDYHSFQMNYGTETTPYVYFSDLRGTDGSATLVATFKGDGSTTQFTINANLPSTNPITSITVAGTEQTYQTDYTYSRTTTYTRITFTTAPASGATILVTYRVTSEIKVFTLGKRKANSNIGAYSLVTGKDNVASGQYSYAGGANNYADYDYQFVLGYYNNNKSDNLFEIGAGTSSSRKNVFEVTKTGGIISAGHSSPIGTVLTASASSQSLTSGTWWQICTLSIPAGTWMVIGFVDFVKFDTTGMGSIRLGSNTSGLGVSEHAGAGSCHGIYYVNSTGSTTLNMSAYHSLSGYTVAMNSSRGRIIAIRIA